jgi:transcriptional regulator with XRE-family HTH domain
MGRPTLGDVIRRQRELQELSLRELARMSGVSNPYLRQIERGMRDPSEDVVEAIATTLDVTTRALYDAAGIVVGAEAGEEPPAVELAIEADPTLKPAQRRALLETYRAFVAANGGPRRPPARRRVRRAG